MPSFQSLAPPAQLALNRRVTQLCQDLHSLGERLREGLARVVGEAVAGAIRDVLHTLLGGNVSLHEDAPQRFRPPYREPSTLWSGTQHRASTSWLDDQLEDQDPPEEYARYEDRDLDEEEEEPEPASSLRESEAPHQARWRHALAMGCQAAAWWLRRGKGRLTLLVALGVGVISTLVVYLGGSLALTGASLVGSVLTLLALARPSPWSTR